MARRGPLLFGLALFVAGVVIWFVPFLRQQREVTSATPVPAALYGQASVDVRPGANLCLDEIPYDATAQVARLTVLTYSKPGVPLVARATGPGYSATTRMRGGYPQGPLEIPIRPATRPLLGNFCIRNAGHRKVALLATPVGYDKARPHAHLNGALLPQDIIMTLHERKPRALAGRVGALLRHASVLTPLGPSVLWILLVLAALGIPVAVAWAFSAALAAAPATAPDLVTRAPRVPFTGAAGRARRAVERPLARLRALPAGFWVALVVALAALFVYIWAARVGTFQNDEDQNVYFARWAADHLPASLWNFTFFERGLQRAEIFALAFPLGLVRSPYALLITHAINAVAFASTAVPLYLICRGLGLRARWAVLAGALGVAVPWAVVATSFLTEPLAYPAYAWTMWALWRAVVRPSWRSQLLALVLLVVAGLSRTAFVLLVPVLPLAVLLHEARFGDWRGARGRARVEAAARALWRDYRVVVLACLAGAGALLLSAAGVLPSPRRLAGSYGTPFNIVWHPFLQKIALYASRVVAGTGFVPFAIGLPWLLRQGARPRDRERAAFATVALLMIVAVLYASYSAGADERYLMYFGLPLFVATAAAFARREIGPLAVAAGGVLAAVLLWRHGWNPNGGTYGFFTAPAESFYARVFLLHMQPHLPSWLSLSHAALILTLALAAVCAYGFSRARHAASIALLLLVALVITQLAQADYAITKFVDGAGARGGPSLEQRAWVDRAIYGKGKAAIILSAQANTLPFDPVWREVQFWNSAVTAQLSNGPLVVRIPLSDIQGQVHPDDRTGRLNPDVPLPRYALVPRGYSDLGVVGKRVTDATYLAAELIVPAEPARLVYHVLGPEPDGFLPPNAGSRIRFFRASIAPGSCGVIPLVAPVDANGSKHVFRWTVRAGGVVRHGKLAGGQTRNVLVPLRFAGTDRFRDVTFATRGRVRIADGRLTSLQIGQIATGRCGR
jgi:hypothetical protein